MWNAINSIFIFFVFLIGRLMFQLYVLFTFGYPKLTTMFKETSMPYWKVTLLMQMCAAITIAAFMNIYWMWLIIKQCARVLQRCAGGGTNAFSAGGPLPDDMDGQASDDEGGATPNRRDDYSDEEDEEAENLIQ